MRAELRLTDEMMKKGLSVIKATVTDKEQFCYVQNISGEKVVLAKDSVIAHIISPVRKTVTVWVIGGQSDKRDSSGSKNRWNITSALSIILIFLLGFSLGSGPSLGALYDCKAAVM